MPALLSLASLAAALYPVHYSISHNITFAPESSVGVLSQQKFRSQRNCKVLIAPLLKLVVESRDGNSSART